MFDEFEMNQISSNVIQRLDDMISTILSLETFISCLSCLFPLETCFSFDLNHHTFIRISFYQQHSIENKNISFKKQCQKEMLLQLNYIDDFHLVDDFDVN